MKNWSGLFLMATATVCLLVSHALASEFSADLVQEMEGGQTTTGKMYVQSNRMRMETQTPEGKVVTIHRPEKNLMWVLMPDDGMYMEMEYQPDPAISQWTEAQRDKATLVGKETISGMETKKYVLTHQGETITYWVNEEIEYPLQVKASGMMMKLENIHKGDVSDSLFEVPAGLEKMMMPMMDGGFSQ